MISMRRHAFTLIELLVVISIIGLLSTVAVVATNSARKNARNARRIADVKQLVTAFNTALNLGGGTYPSTGGDVWVCVSSVCTGNFAFGNNAGVDAFFTPYMPTKPTDPTDSNARTATGYVYDGAWPGNASFPAGSYLNYLLELPATCGVGALFNTTTSYVQCLVQLQ